MTVLPDAFTTVAPCGTCTRARGPAAVMRSPLTRIDRIVDGGGAGAVDEPRADDGGDRSGGSALRLGRCAKARSTCRAQSQGFASHRSSE